jgi:DNA polymerase-3 subunit alpha
VNRATLEALAHAGALDAFGAHRAQVVAGLDPCLKMAAAAQEDRKAGQMALFGGGAPASSAAPGAGRGALPDVPRWPETQMLALEKESLGVYMSSHPLAKHERALAAFSTHRRDALASAGNGARVRIAGMISHLKTQFPKTGRNVHRKFARFRVEEAGGGTSCVMFADQYEAAQAVLANEAIGFIEGTLDLTREEEPDVKVDRFFLVDAAYEEFAESLVLAPAAGEEARIVPVVRRLLREFPGKARVLFEMSPAPGIRARYRVESGGVRPCPELHQAAAAELGDAGVRWTARKVAPGRQPSHAWSE